MGISQCRSALRVWVDFSRLPQHVAADIHGVAPVTLRRWTARGCPRNVDGTYDAPRTIRWRCAQPTDSAGRLLAFRPWQSSGAAT
jgi:hypothetical protein